MRISDWSSDVCSSDLASGQRHIAPDRSGGLDRRNRRLSYADLAPAPPRMAGGTPNFVAESRSILARRYDLRHRPRRHRSRQQPDDRRRLESRAPPRLALWTIAPCQSSAVTSADLPVGTAMVK